MKNHKSGDASIRTSAPGNNLLFTAGSLAVIAGLLLPATGVLSDILLSFCIFISFAMGLIAFSNTPADELKGFSNILIIASAVRTFTSVYAVKLVLTGSAFSLIAQYLSGPLQSGVLLSAGLLGALLLVLAGMAVRQSRSVQTLIRDYFEKTLRVKQLYIESARRANIIGEEDVEMLLRQTEQASRFFSLASVAARFTLCETIIHCCIYVIGIVGVFIISAMESSQQSFSVFSVLCELSIMLTLIIMLAVISVFSLGSVSRKYDQATQTLEEDGTEPQTQKIKAVSSELVDDPFEAVDKKAKSACSSTGQEASPSSLLKPGQRMLWQSHNLKTKSHYELVAQILRSESFDQTKIVLIAGDSYQALPVTIPANLAVRLSRSGLTCLLVDLDIHRESVAKAFEVTMPDYKAGKFLAKSNFKGLALLVADLVKRLTPDKAAKLIDMCTKKYDRILLYAPQIAESKKISKIADCCTSAMLFSQRQDSPFMQQLRNTLENRGCDILEPDEILVEVDNTSP